jgi:hypothetical protein
MQMPAVSDVSAGGDLTSCQCDTQRPSCGQCRRLGLECAGYSRDLVWVNTTERGTSYRAQSITLPDKLTQSAYESRYLGFFWLSYLPNGQALLSDAAQDSLGGWSNTIQALYPSSDILKKTLLALCLTSTGKLDGNKWMVQQGLGMYVGAMQDMSVALRKPSSALSDAILTTAKLFSLYEVSTAAVELVSHFRLTSSPVFRLCAVQMKKNY